MDNPNYIEAREVASQLVYGRHYQNNEPIKYPETFFLFVKTDATVLYRPAAKDAYDDASRHRCWQELAERIEKMLDNGYADRCSYSVNTGIGRARIFPMLRVRSVELDPCAFSDDGEHLASWFVDLERLEKPGLQLKICERHRLDEPRLLDRIKMEIEEAEGAKLGAALRQKEGNR